MHYEFSNTIDQIGYLSLLLCDKRKLFVIAEIEVVPVANENEETEQTEEETDKSEPTLTRSNPIGAGGAKKLGQLVDYTNWGTTLNYQNNLYTKRFFMLFSLR